MSNEASIPPPVRYLHVLLNIRHNMQATLSMACVVVTLCMCRRLCLSHCMKAASSLAGLGAMETWQDALRSAHTAGIVKAEMKREGDAEMGADPAAEAAVRTVQRCLLLLSLAAETGQVRAVLTGQIMQQTDAVLRSNREPAGPILA